MQNDASVSVSDVQLGGTHSLAGYPHPPSPAMHTLAPQPPSVTQEVAQQIPPRHCPDAHSVPDVHPCPGAMNGTHSLPPVQ